MVVSSMCDAGRAVLVDQVAVVEAIQAQR